ncbi:MAG: HAD-IA family hydrolase [Bacteroidota bacterium]|nr:HAD-IA family hydrolase [Bacteroidota bacterium]MDP4231740.1 HAD-IA family hydrolase [Bacteroidota bacterium]MDP4243476.1 HAD-IA family hydrolase [Bacteroidota bacterium]MDP4289359.1 HAD-IA family hydrolase [Bacteroidota bacterium]
MLKAVLFDLDDTLFDHRHSSREALALLQQDFFGDRDEVTLDELEAANHAILNEVHVEVLAGTLGPDEARVKRFGMFFRRFGIKLSTHDLQIVAASYRANYQSSWRAMPGAEKLLRALRHRGVKTSIVTNNLVEEQMSKLARCGLLELLDSITISEEAGFSKPDARIFQIALDRLGLEAQETVMIGDAWENDILGARAAGIRSVWYNAYSSEPPERTVPEIRTFEDSDAILRLLFL